LQQPHLQWQSTRHQRQIRLNHTRPLHVTAKNQEHAQELNLKFLWYTPTQYCQFNPIEHGLGVKTCTAALINMCVGPNGDVYPCQSYFENLGNILIVPWQKIWNHPTAKVIRNRAYIEPKCKACPELQLCGGGCPLQLQNGKYVCTESE
jgi:radical SAM protein with 4Fe4S-binding SPASM domain